MSVKFKKEEIRMAKGLKKMHTDGKCLRCFCNPNCLRLKALKEAFQFIPVAFTCPDYIELTEARAKRSRVIAFNSKVKTKIVYDWRYPK